MAKDMTIMEELRSKSIDELAKINEDRRAELFALKFQAAVGSLEQTHKIPLLKHEIARIEMLLAEHRKKGEIAKIQKAMNAALATSSNNEEVKAESVKNAAPKKEVAPKVEEAKAEFVKVAAPKKEVAPKVEEAKAESVKVAAPKEKVAPKVEEVKAEPVKVAAPKKEATPKAKEIKAESVKVAAPKKEATPKAKEVKAESVKVAAPKKEATPKAKEVKVESKLVAKGKTIKEVKKPDLKEEIKTPKVEGGKAKATGKGKAAIGEVEFKKLSNEIAIGEDIEAIELKLEKKPKNAKTYVFGQNAQAAKKQIDEANKKAAEKKLNKTVASKGVKK